MQHCKPRDKHNGACVESQCKMAGSEFSWVSKVEECNKETLSDLAACQVKGQDGTW